MHILYGTIAELQSSSNLIQIVFWTIGIILFSSISHKLSKICELLEENKFNSFNKPVTQPKTSIIRDTEDTSYSTSNGSLDVRECTMHSCTYHSKGQKGCSNSLCKSPYIFKAN